MVTKRQFAKLSPKYRTIFLWLMLLYLGHNSGHAQVSHYLFTKSNETYTPLTAGFLVGKATEAGVGNSTGSATLTNHTFAGQLLPFTYYFNGAVYKAININTNGWVSFTNDTGSAAIPRSPLPNANNPIGTAPEDIIAAFGCSLMGVYATTADRTTGSNLLENVANTSQCRIGTAIQGPGIPTGTTIVAFTANTITLSAAATAASTGTYLSFATGEIRTETQGLGTNRVFVIQYKGFSQFSLFATTFSNNTSCEFQIRLYEANGKASAQKVEIVYGNWSRLAGTAIGQVGLGGKAYDFNVRTSSADWSTSTAGPSAFASLSWNTSVLPQPGLVYSWTMPPCIMPGGLSVPASSITKNGAGFNWSIPAAYAAPGYDWEVRTSGTAGSGNAGLAASGASTTTTVSTTGLLPATSYKVYVRSACGSAEGNSAWTEGMAFTTLCNAYAFNFLEGFNNGLLPSCWSTNNDSANSDGFYLWRFAGDPYGLAAPALNGRASGTYAWVADKGNAGIGNVNLISPPVDLTGWKEPALYFDLFSNNAQPSFGINPLFKVEVNNGSGWQSIFSDSSNFDYWRNNVVVLPPAYTNTTIQFKFSVFQNSYSGYTDILLDSVLLREAPTCYVPSEVSGKPISSGSVVIHWTAPVKGTPTSYDWELRLPGSAPGSGASGLVASGSTMAPALTDTLNGLKPLTEYTVFIKSHCSGSDYSLWSSGRFMTPAAVPWNEPFLVLGEHPKGWNINYGWQIDALRGANGNPGHNIFSSFWGFGDEGTKDSFATVNVGMVRATDVLRFDYKAADYQFPYAPPAAGSGVFRVSVSTDAGKSYVVMDTLPIGGDSSWKTQTYSLKAFAGQLVKVKIAADWIDGDYDLAFDNFYIGPCGYPNVDLGKNIDLCASVASDYEIDAKNTLTGVHYLWDNDDTGPTRKVKASGTYYVTVTSGVCFQTDTVQVTFHPGPEIDLGPDTLICKEPGLTLDAGNIGCDYIWDDRSTGQLRTLNQDGKYFVTVTDTNGCGVSDTLMVGLIPSPSGSITIVDKGRNTYQYSVGNAKGVQHVIWDFGNGRSNTGLTVENTYFKDGKYTIKMILIGVCGDSLIQEESLVVEGLTINEPLIKDAELLTLYPNPASHTLNVAGKDNLLIYGLTIYNLLGQKMYRQDMHRLNSGQLDVSALAPGVYTLSIETDSGIVIRKFEVLY